MLDIIYFRVKADSDKFGYSHRSKLKKTTVHALQLICCLDEVEKNRIPRYSKCPLRVTSVVWFPELHGDRHTWLCNRRKVKRTHSLCSTVTWRPELRTKDKTWNAESNAHAKQAVPNHKKTSIRKHWNREFTQYHTMDATRYRTVLLRVSLR